MKASLATTQTYIREKRECSQQLHFTVGNRIYNYIIGYRNLIENAHCPDSIRFIEFIKNLREK